MCREVAPIYLSIYSLGSLSLSLSDSPFSLGVEYRFHKPIEKWHVSIIA